MQFIATLEHDPDNCWARPDKEETAMAWITSLEDHAAEHDVDLHGAYATPNEHKFYFIMEADTFEAVSSFLGPPLLVDHDGHVAPVTSLADAADALLEEER